VVFINDEQFMMRKIIWRKSLYILKEGADGVQVGEVEQVIV
jgi:hypothetical protein